MAEPKTKKNNASVAEFLNRVPNTRRREDAFTVLRLMREATREEPAMWGDSIVGFGIRHYTYATGREGDWPRIGFSPRKASLSIYLTCGSAPNARLLQRLGKHKMGTGCLYINKLDDVDLAVLKELIQKSFVEAGSMGS